MEPVLCKAPGFCIYCGATQNTTVDKRLGDEHPIPYSLESRLEIPEAACANCEGVISSEFEHRLLKGTFQCAREHLNFRSQNKKKRKNKNKYRIKANGGTHIWEATPGNATEHPPVVWLPTWPDPRILEPQDYMKGRIDGGQWVYIIDEDREAAFRNMNNLQDYQLGIYLNDFSRFLAKIGHGVAVHMLGTKGFDPLLRRYILHGDDMEYFDLVGGGHEKKFDDCMTAVGYQWVTQFGISYLVVAINIFALFTGPVYYVVAGTKPSHKNAEIWATPPPAPDFPRQVDRERLKEEFDFSEVIKRLTEKQA